MDSRWRVISKDLVFTHSKYLSVENHIIQLPDGKILDKWPWVIMPDYVNVIVLTEEKEYICFKQDKYGIEEESFAPVGGYLEPGEEPLVGAKRELLEETGFVSSDWINLGTFVVDSNRGAGKAYFYLALNAVKVAESDSDDIEDQLLIRMSHEEIEQALLNQGFKTLPWVAIVSLSMQYINYNKII